LPAGITAGQVEAALGALTTARVSYRLTVRVRGQDVPATGGGLIDFGSDREHSRISVGGTQVEHLDVGADRFRLLSPGRQQATGKAWLWVQGCPRGNCVAQALAAVPHIASCTGSGAETLAGEPVHRYSFSLKPRRGSFPAGVPDMEKDLHAHLHAHGLDRLSLDIWLQGDQAVRKIRVHEKGLDLALLDGRTSIVTGTREYSDFGVTVDLAAPAADEVLGSPGHAL
jgi:hypothetical protein